MNDSFAVIELTPTGLRFLDQTRLPGEEVMVATADHRDILGPFARCACAARR